MATKELTIYFLKLSKVSSIHGTHGLVSRTELSNLLRAIIELPIQIDSSPSRYHKINESEYCVATSADNIGLNIPSESSFINGIFFKRRNTAYPFDDDGEGTLQELRLSNTKSEIAEVTYFLIDKASNIVSWVSNKRAGSSQTFEKYLNRKLHYFRESRFSEYLQLNGEPAELELSYIMNPNAIHEFREQIENIRAAEIKVTGNLNSFEALSNSQNLSTTRKKIKSILDLKKNLNSSSLYLKFTVGHNRHRSLVKNLLVDIHNVVKDNLSEKDTFAVKGSIDEQTRVLDLVNSYFMYKTQIWYNERYIPAHTVFESLSSAYSTYQTDLLAQTQNGSMIHE